MSNLLYYYGMCDVVKDCLLQRYFGKVRIVTACDIFCIFWVVCYLLSCVLITSVVISNPQRVRGGSVVPESDIMQACRSVCTMHFYYPALSTIISL